MSWPFVSRAVHREFLASAEARARAEHENAQNLRHALANAESRADQERAERIAAVEAGERRHADLLAKFTTLRLQGAQEPTPPPVPYTPRESDPCVQAINAKFSGNRAGLRAGAMRQLASDRAKGIPDEAILKAIEDGVTDLADIPV